MTDASAVVELPAPRPDRPKWRGWRHAALFLWPAVVLLGVYVAYPLVFSLVRSTFDGTGERFVGVDNYVEALTDDRTLVAFRNNVLWVLFAPTVVTALGLLFAVLTERIRWATAFRLVLFMPMAISLFASGVIFRLVYEQDPELGLANAAVVATHDVFASPSEYPGARPRPGGDLTVADANVVVGGRHEPGEIVRVPLVGFSAQRLPAESAPAVAPDRIDGDLAGVVWLDVSPGGTRGTIDTVERGMPRVVVQLVSEGTVVASTTTGDTGAFVFPDVDPARSHQIVLPAENFAPPFRGLTWLGAGLVTPVIMSAWVWIMTGFAMTFIAAGLAAIPRDALEAARVDGATEFQVFRRVTVPLLAPVLIVVLVTLVINALKIFELVYVVAPGSVQADANVLALQMWQVSFGAGGDQGLGSALGIILFLLVIPAMVFNIRRFRRERSR